VRLDRYLALLAPDDGQVVSPETLSPLDPSERLRRGQCSETDRTAVYRRRLLRALIDCVAELGYANTSVADISRRAVVSHRTFYEHFAGKDEAFLAAYRAASSLVMRSVLKELTPGRPWNERLLAAMAAYIDSILWDPAASTVFLREPAVLGGSITELHLLVMRNWADLIKDEVQRTREEDHEAAVRVAALDDYLSLAVIHGIQAIVLDAIRSGADRSEILRPCVILLCGAAQADVHVFEGFLRRVEGRRDVLRLGALLLG
jgi:AcrR family transcriptional regulator